MKIAVTGWCVGFQKVKFTQMLRHELGYTLSRAKASTDSILEDESLELEIQEEESERLISLLHELGIRESHVIPSHPQPLEQKTLKLYC